MKGGLRAFRHVGAHVAVHFLHALRHLERVLTFAGAVPLCYEACAHARVRPAAHLGGDGLSPVAHQFLHERRYVAASEGDVFDAAADDVAVRDGNHVRHAVARVHDRAGQSAFLHLF